MVRSSKLVLLMSVSTLLLSACGGARPFGVGTPGGEGPTPVHSPDVTNEPTSSGISGGSASVDPDFTPGTAGKDPSEKKGKAKTPNPPDTATTAPPDPGNTADKWEGTQFETAYELEFQICKEFGVKEVAKEYGSPADPIDAAIAVSETYQPAFQQAAFEGCLDGFNAR
jgi:hypothetical protein